MNALANYIRGCPSLTLFARHEYRPCAKCTQTKCQFFSQLLTSIGAQGPFPEEEIAQAVSSERPQSLHRVHHVAPAFGHLHTVSEAFHKLSHFEAFTSMQPTHSSLAYCPFTSPSLLTP